MKIAVSAGHDPRKRGACFEGFCEHELAVKWQASVMSYLGEDGIRVPPDVPLMSKIKWINAHPEITVAIEIHFNAGGFGAKGCETLYAPNSSRGMRVAETVQKAISSFCAPNRGIKEGWYRMDRPGHSDYPGDVEGDEIVDAFLRLTKPPAIIVEPFFINELIRINELRETVCEVMAEALIESATILERRVKT
jgi:N-acetylmuramoyl-L-alanine amidase